MSKFKELLQSAISAYFEEKSDANNITVDQLRIEKLYIELPEQESTESDSETSDIKEFVIVPWQPTGTTDLTPFVSMNFSESLITGPMFGTLYICDYRNWTNELILNGNVWLNLEINIGDADKKSKFKFNVYSAKNITNEANIHEYNNLDERYSIWQLDLISSEIFLSNYTVPFLEGEDFVGPLSENTKEKAEEEEIEEEDVETKDLINTIIDFYKLPKGKIDTCKTGVWLKHNHVAYPWMKRKGQVSLTRLLKYVEEYAFDGGPSENYNLNFVGPIDVPPLKVDYYCWHDRNGWNFRSISKMIEESNSAVDDAFIVTTDELNPKRIMHYEVLSQYDLQGLFDSGALISYYKRYDPNYDNPYIDFTDSTDSLLERDVTYNYHRDFERSSLIEKYPLIPEHVNTDPVSDTGTPKEMTKVDDAIYGYFNENVLNTPHPVAWEVFTNRASSPWSKKSWQPQFDLTDLEFSTFEKIHTKIRVPLKKKREEYAKKKNIKRKWETYRCSICCHENGALGSTQDIALFANPGPTSGITYQALFGPNGIYGSTVEDEYKIVAAGSFTDTLNYNPGNTFNERGLTYSYDLSKEPYNQSIGQFFNITGPTAPEAYTKYAIQRSVNIYNIIIEKIAKRISDIDNFIANVESYKANADQIFGEALLDKESRISRPIDLTQGFRYVGNSIPGEQQFDWPISEQEYGLVPYTSIPAGKGVGQVIFGADPNGAQITFRFADTENFNGYSCVQCSGEGSAVCYAATLDENNQPYCETPGSRLIVGECGLINIDQFTQENCVVGACCIQSNGVPNCIPESLRLSCEDIGGDFRLGENCAVCLGGDGGDGPGCSSQGSDCVWCCLRGSAGDSPVFIPRTQCDALSQQEPPLGFEVADPEDCQYDGGGGNELEVCCGVNFACSTFPVGICDQVGGTVVQSCKDCGFEPPDGGGGGGGGTPGPRGPTGPTGPTGPSALPTEEDIVYIDPSLLYPCSFDPVVRGYVKYVTEAAAGQYSPIYDYAAPYLWDDRDGTNVKDWSFFDYGSESGLIPAIADPDVVSETQNCLLNGGCYNTTCLSSNALESLRRTVSAERQLLSVEYSLFQSLKDNIVQKFKSSWTAAYAEWHQRNAFFFAKNPGQSVFKNETRETVQSPISLQNIKSITRKEVRGSRYELLARSSGITGASAGQWMYEIYFGGNSGSTAHPYYEQGYNEDGFISSRSPHVWFSVDDADATDNPPIGGDDQFGEYGPNYSGQEYIETGVIHSDLYSINSDNIIPAQNVPSNQYGYAQSDLSGDTRDYKDTYNFFDIAGKKPANIKKEEISSYVRIEFQTPIGLDFIKDFPNGFIRDAGIEYFLPYLVNLTPGPFGRQGVKYNIAVIGMDPYGFDVAVKKIKDDIPTNRKLQGIDKGNYYNWWNHDTGAVLSKTDYLTSDYNGMDLWPEVGFETEYPYYAYDPMQEDMHGGGYDLDFHNGGGYYFENQSQDWMESLYHYGVSSGKQFDPLYRTSVVGSYILPNSYRKLKPHRSWWSLFVPKTMFIPIRFANMFKTPNTKARDLFGGSAIFTISPNYWRTWYGSEFETWLSLDNNDDTRNLLETQGSDLTFFIEGKEGDSISANKFDPETSISGYFHQSLLNYLAGNYNLYRPNLVTTDLWKYDLSGETEYGLVTPPVDTEYDFFDRNFAAQFVVYSRIKSGKTCSDLGLSCVKPVVDIVSSSGCTADPYCNCPAQNVKPTEPEPTYVELYRLEKEINECGLIAEYLGPEYLGCEYSDPKSTCSCNCPEWGPKFKDYLAYTRTYATFWETPIELPLVRVAQTSQLFSQKLMITVPSSKDIQVGSIVVIGNENDNPEFTKDEYKAISGKWMVSEIMHFIRNVQQYNMILTLVRNSNFIDPNKSAIPKTVYEEI